MQRFDPIYEGGKLSAREMQEAFREIERLANLSASPPLRLAQQSSGLHLSLDVEIAFPAKLILRQDRAYGWIEQLPQTGGSFSNRPLIRSGTPFHSAAYELTGNTQVPYGTIVWMRIGFPNPSAVGREYLFDHCCPGIPIPNILSRTIPTDCCPGGTPEQLQVHITGGCFDGKSIPIDYDDGSGAWLGSITGLCGAGGSTTLSAFMYCASGTLYLQMTCQPAFGSAQQTTNSANSVSCSATSPVFLFSSYAFAVCGNIVVSVTG